MAKLLQVGVGGLPSPLPWGLRPSSLLDRSPRVEGNARPGCTPPPSSSTIPLGWGFCTFQTTILAGAAQRPRTSLPSDPLGCPCHPGVTSTCSSQNQTHWS